MRIPRLAYLLPSLAVTSAKVWSINAKDKRNHESNSSIIYNRKEITSLADGILSNPDFDPTYVRNMSKLEKHRNDDPLRRLEIKWIQKGQDIDGEGAMDQSGMAMVISADGTTLAIGASYNDAEGNLKTDAGHVRIYKISSPSNMWQQIGKDIDGDEAGDRFGTSVGLSRDGNIVAIGGFLHNNERGHVKIFRLQDSKWVQRGKDIDGIVEGGHFGRSIAMSDEGNIIAIGAPLAGDIESGGVVKENTGQVRVFSYSFDDDSYIQKGSALNGDAEEDSFGFAVAMSGNGLRIAAGMYKNYSSTGAGTGKVRLLKFHNDDWTQLCNDIEGPTNENDQFGMSVAMSKSGHNVAIGSPFSDANGYNSGKVQVYCVGDDFFYPLGNPIEGESASDASGVSIDLSDNGEILAIGGFMNSNQSGFASGHTRIFKLSGENDWDLVGNDIDGEFASDLFGRSVSISGDGKLVAVGGPNNDGGNKNNAGHVRVFAFADTDTDAPSPFPSKSETIPSGIPTASPSVSKRPTAAPTVDPATTAQPSTSPTERPSVTAVPTSKPSASPTSSTLPSSSPSTAPSVSSAPTSTPSVSPTISAVPSSNPTASPTSSVGPTSSPTTSPTVTLAPTSKPSSGPTLSAVPSNDPTASPTVTVAPTSKPSTSPTKSEAPSSDPTVSPTVSVAPTSKPSSGPTLSAAPSSDPTASPTLTVAPTSKPSTSPTSSAAPSNGPTASPTVTVPTSAPTAGPTLSAAPSSDPTVSPTLSVTPTSKPSTSPTMSIRPSSGPTVSPTVSFAPTNTPSASPTFPAAPTNSPTASPSSIPSSSVVPSPGPTRKPAENKTPAPSSLPSFSVEPTTFPEWRRKGQNLFDYSKDVNPTIKSVAISQNGDHIAVGDPTVRCRCGSGSVGANCGEVKVYFFSDGIWNLWGDAISEKITDSKFGMSVAMSRSGDSIIVGCSNSASVYRNIDGIWIKVGNSIPGESIGDFFGWSVSVADSGEVVAIGGPRNTGEFGDTSGHARIFKLGLGNEWVQVGKDLDGEAAFNFSGRAVSISADGETVIVGAFGNTGLAGHARVFKFSSTNSWEQIGLDIDGGASGDQFGETVDISQDGSIVAIGAPYSDVAGVESGSVQMFKNINGSWVQYGETITETANEKFGKSVSLSNTGTVVAVGSRTATFEKVRIYRYTPESDLWIQIGEERGLRDISLVDLAGYGKTLIGSGRDVVQVYEYGLPSNPSPTNFPTNRPSAATTNLPTRAPSFQPSLQPSSQPTGLPPSKRTDSPTADPSPVPTDGPSMEPSKSPSTKPIDSPTANPTPDKATDSPAANPSSVPTGSPTPGLSIGSPTAVPTDPPTPAHSAGDPTTDTTEFPTPVSSIGDPTADPTSSPTVVSSMDFHPTNVPSTSPSIPSSSSMSPTILASPAPSNFTVTNMPTVSPIISTGYTIDLWQQFGQDIYGTNSGDSSGFSVALSKDGSCVAIGAPYNDQNGVNSGEVRVFQFTNGSWNQLGSTLRGENVNTRFGTSVDLSSNCDSLAVGGILNLNESGIRSGHARLYKLNVNQWSQVAKDIDGLEAGDQFGRSVSLSDDGNIIAVASPKADRDLVDYDTGVVKVFEYSIESNSLEPKGKEISGIATGDHFGHSISLSSSGNIIAIGSFGFDSFIGDNAGRVQILLFDGNNWIEKGGPIYGSAAGDQTGFSVSLSSDGETVAVGSPFRDADDKIDVGMVQVYRLIEGSWKKLGQNILCDDANSICGYSISLSSDGNVVAIGSLLNNGSQSTSDTDHVSVYELIDKTEWRKVGFNALNGDQTSNFYGRSVSLSGDGEHLAVSSPGADGVGKVQIYGRLSVAYPSSAPSAAPSFFPTASSYPSSVPTSNPSSVSSDSPSISPSSKPTLSASPTVSPTSSPSSLPTLSASPTVSPTSSPSSVPTISASPTVSPTSSPSSVPTISVSPTLSPTSSPSSTPTLSASPTLSPTSSPSSVPTSSVSPTPSPTSSPSSVLTSSVSPTLSPTSNPSSFPSLSASPTIDLTPGPSSTPSLSTLPTVDITLNPSSTPSLSVSPTMGANVTIQPSMKPSTQSSNNSTMTPTINSTMAPSLNSPSVPSTHPTEAPTVFPSQENSASPSTSPASKLSASPSISKGSSVVPTLKKSTRPTLSTFQRPSNSPSENLSLPPSSSPSSNPSASSVPSSPSAFWELIGDIEGAAGGDYFGWSVALSSDAQTIAVGSIFNEANGSNAGSVQVFRFSDGGYRPLGGPIYGLAGDSLGTSLALSQDGNSFIVGAKKGDSPNGADSGEVRVYSLDPNVGWMQKGSSIYGLSLGDQAGVSVDISYDGNIIAVGSALNSNANGQSAGQVRIFEYAIDRWIQLGSPLYGESSYDNFGSTLALAGDGHTIGIGGPTNDKSQGSGYYYGHVRVFRLSDGGEWEQLGDDIDGKDQYGLFGTSISISQSGNIIGIGKYDGVNNGVSIYNFLDGQWTILGDEIPFGISVSLSNDGQIAAIGDYKKGLDSGEVRTFKYIDGSWNKIGESLSGIDKDQLGRSVAISGNGQIVAAGAPGHNGQSGARSGKIEVYKSGESRAFSWLRSNGGYKFPPYVTASSSSLQSTSLIIRISVFAALLFQLA